VGRYRGGEKTPDRHPGPDRQTDGQTHKHTRQNLYILATRAVTNMPVYGS